MRKQLTLIIFLLLGMAAMAQIKVPSTRLEINLPANQWQYFKTLKGDKNTTSYIYYYVDQLVLEESGDTVVPWLRVVVRKNYNGSALDYSADRWVEQPFQTLDEQTDNLPATDGIAYLGAYTSPNDKKDYMFRMLYLKDRNQVVEIRLETSKETFAQFDETFAAIINSVRLTK